MVTITEESYLYSCFKLYGNERLCVGWFWCFFISSLRWLFDVCVYIVCICVGQTERKSVKSKMGFINVSNLSLQKLEYQEWSCREVMLEKQWMGQPVDRSICSWFWTQGNTPSGCQKVWSHCFPKHVKLK